MEFIFIIIGLVALLDPYFIVDNIIKYDLKKEEWKQQVNAHRKFDPNKKFRYQSVYPSINRSDLRVDQSFFHGKKLYVFMTRTVGFAFILFSLFSLYVDSQIR